MGLHLNLLLNTRLLIAPAIFITFTPLIKLTLPLIKLTLPLIKLTLPLI